MWAQQRANGARAADESRHKRADCPSDDVLRAFAVGALRPIEVERIALHLSTSPHCPCQAYLTSLETVGDTLTSALRRMSSGENGTATNEVADTDEAEPSPHGDDQSAASGAASDAPAASLGIEQVGRYRILSRIGRGGMGEVYRARDDDLRRDVAVKLVRPDRSIASSSVARFRSEAATVARLDHANIVPLYEVRSDGDVHFIAMKLIDGVPLDACGSRFEQDLRRGAEVVRDVARAIHFAHQRQVLHRDLKPGNVLIDEAGTPYVADFGLAKRLDEQSGLTMTGTVLGTPSYGPSHKKCDSGLPANTTKQGVSELALSHFFPNGPYMAPEQAAGLHAEITSATDVYGLGAILYFVLTGRPPFEGHTPVDTCRQVIDDEPTPPSHIDPQIDRDLETICLKCLAKSQADRFMSAASVAAELDRWLAGEPIRARPATRRERLVRWCRRRPAVAALVAAVAGLALVVAVGSPIAAVAINLQRRHAEQSAIEAGERADEATRNLFAASYNLARAERLAARPGARDAGLAAIRAAVTASESVPVNPAEQRDLRSVAIGLFALPSIRRESSWQFDTRGIATDPHLDYYAYVEDESRQVIVGGMKDGETIARIPGLKVYGGDHSLFLAPRASHIVVSYRDEQNYRQIYMYALGERSPRWKEKLDPQDIKHFLSADGRYFGITAGNEGVFRVLDARSGELVREIATGVNPYLCKTHPTRPWIAIVDRSPRVVCYDLSTGEKVAEHDFPVGATGFAFGGNDSLVAYSQGQELYLWDADQRSIAWSFPGHRHHIWHAQFAADGRLLASTSWDGTARLWSTRGGNLLATFPAIGSALHPTEARMALTGASGGRSAIDTWVIDEAREFRAIAVRGSALTPRSVDVSTDGRLLIAAGDNGIRVFDMATALQTQFIPLQRAYGVVCLPDGGEVLVNSVQGLFRFPLTDEPRSLLSRKAKIADSYRFGGRNCVATSVDGNRIAAVRDEGHVLLIDQFDRENQTERVIDAEVGRGHVDVSPDGRLVAALHDGSLTVWDFETSEALAQFGTYQLNYDNVSPNFAPSGEILLIGDQFQYAAYDTETWKLR